MSLWYLALPWKDKLCLLYSPEVVISDDYCRWSSIQDMDLLMVDMCLLNHMFVAFEMRAAVILERERLEGSLAMSPHGLMLDSLYALSQTTPFP
jgi:hypothetical protein